MRRTHSCQSAALLLLTSSSLHSVPPVPVDRLPVLLIANSQNIQATSLSSTIVHSLLSTSTKQTTAMDFVYAEETVCWIHVGDTPSSTHLKCAKIPNLKSFAEERVINISLSLQRECSEPSAASRAQLHVATLWGATVRSTQSS